MHCNELKLKEEFYRLYSGYLQKKCKKCVSKTNKEKRLELKRKRNAFKIF